MKIRVLILFCAFITIVHAQDYQPVFSGVRAYFEPDELINSQYYNGEKFYRALEMNDSLDMGIPVLYNFRENHYDNYEISLLDDFDCNHPDKSSWIGWKTMLLNNGVNVFFNRNYDSIFIHTLADLNEPWIFYKINDSLYYTAEVIDHDTMSFLGITDSIKSIQISLNDSVKNLLTDTTNFQILLSKEHGFVRTINFRDFPGFGPETFPVIEHQLVGFSLQNLGHQKLTKGDIYDFDRDDIIHRTFNYMSGSGGGYLHAIHEYLKRIDYGSESTWYLIDRIQWGGDYTGNSSYINDTIEVTYHNQMDHIQVGMPFESIYNDWELWCYVVYRNEDYNSRPRLYTLTPQFQYGIVFDSCYTLPFEYFDIWHNWHIKGCGVNSQYFDPLSNNSSQSTIVYYKKGDDEWGTPLTPPVGIHHTQAIPDMIKLAPNPADKSCTISSHGNKIAEIRIFNLPGQLKGTFLVMGKNYDLDSGSLEDGIYLIEITNIDGRKVVKKLSVQH